LSGLSQKEQSAGKPMLEKLNFKAKSATIKQKLFLVDFTPFIQNLKELKALSFSGLSIRNDPIYEHSNEQLFSLFSANKKLEMITGCEEDFQETIEQEFKMRQTFNKNRGETRLIKLDLILYC
jgi:hypothetical protein